MRYNSLEQVLKNCMLCPRKCGVDRERGNRGVCGQTDQLKVARAALHMWEEPCISGKNGSGAVFFSGCALHCVFCQNQNIANGKAGIEITIDRLADIFLELQNQKANNINLVTPGQFVPQIIKALDIAKRKGLVIPIVYNTSSYESVETLHMLDGYVDVYLPDLKYMDSARGLKYSHASDYFEVASEAIQEMVRQTGSPKFLPEAEVSHAFDKTNQWMSDQSYQEYTEKHDGDGIMVKGTVVRHLLLPEGLDDSKNIMKYLLETYKNNIFISLMSQYTPLLHTTDYPELNRTVTKAEYDQLVDYAIDLGIENGFIQEGEAASESFIPEFDGYGVLHSPKTNG